MVVLQATEDFHFGMAVGVVVGDGDDGIFGRHRSQEARSSRGLAAMVADLQQIGVKRLSQHALLTGCLGIAFEQDRGLPVGDMEYQGIVVAGGRAGGVTGWRGKHFDLGAAESKAVAGSHGFDRYVEPVSLGQERLVGGNTRVVAHPKRPRTKVLQDGGHATHVIAVRVGERDGIEPPDIAGPQDRGDDVFPDFKVGVRGLGAPNGPPGIDEQGFPLGRDQQQRIALPDIDGGDLEYAGMVGERSGIKDTRSGTGQRKDQEPTTGKRLLRAAHTARPISQHAGNDGEDPRAGEANVARAHGAEELHDSVDGMQESRSNRRRHDSQRGPQK